MVFQVISKFFKESASFSLGSFCIILQWQKLEQNNVALVYHAKHFYVPLCVSGLILSKYCTKPHLDSTLPFWFALLNTTPEWVRVAQRRECHSQFLASPWKGPKLLFYTYKVTHTEALVFLSQGEFLSSVILPAPPHTGGWTSWLRPGPGTAAATRVLWATPLVIPPFLAEDTGLGKKREGKCPQLYRGNSSNCQTAKWLKAHGIKKHKLWNTSFSCLSSLCVLSCFSRAQLFSILWTLAHQAPLSMGFSRQKY